MHRARERLDKLEMFDGKEKAMDEFTWRRRFRMTVDAYKVSDDQRLELWREKVELDTPAGDWMEAKEAEATNPIATWSGLETELEARWPRRSKDDKDRERVVAWYGHTFDEGALGTEVIGAGGRTERYWVAWAKAHMALAASTSGAELEKVQYTWVKVLPLSIRGMLTKKMTDYKTITSLCTEIIALEEDRVLQLVEQGEESKGIKEWMGDLAARFGHLEMSQQAYNRPAQTLARAGQTAYPRSSLRFAGPTTSQPNRPPQAQPAIPLPATRSSTPADQTQPNLNTTAPLPTAPTTPARSFPNLRNQPPLAPVFTPQPPVTPVPTVARSQSTGANQYPYPVSPGTLMPAEKVCVRCGMGEHPALSCVGVALPEVEIKGREETRKELMRQQLGLRSPPRTPWQTRSLFQLLVDNGLEEEAQALYLDGDYEESGNGEDQ